uniref:Uncharacterized protein n=1 Tax=Streptomyces violaceoruber TaxID=1935 RepID=Q849E6_STRVN|nr:hypothetical protein [Streptomyces violaceoruber]
MAAQTMSGGGGVCGPRRTRTEWAATPRAPTMNVRAPVTGMPSAARAAAATTTTITTITSGMVSGPPTGSGPGAGGEGMGRMPGPTCRHAMPGAGMGSWLHRERPRATSRSARRRG